MKGYVALIEPEELYNALKGNQDMIIRCLEVIRLALPQIIETEPSVEYDLVAVSNPFGPPYPAVGVYDPYLQMKMGWMEINEKVDYWVQQTGLNSIVRKASDIFYINWEKLSLIVAFPP